MSDIFQTPKAELTAAEGDSDNLYGSVEKGIAGDYELNVSETLSQAWDATSGAKLSILGALVLVGLVNAGAALALATLFGLLLPELAPSAAGLLLQLIMLAVMTPLNTGLVILGIQRAGDVEISAFSIFEHYDKTVPLFLTVLLMSLLISVGIMLLVLPGIYLAIAYVFALPLVVDKGLSPWQALEASRKAVTHSWFKIFGIMILLLFFVWVSMLPLLLGLIWSLPFSFVAMGMIYRTLFGINKATLTES